MRTLNQQKLRWVIRQMKLEKLSVWQVAKTQSITPRHARRLFARFKNSKQPRLKKPGRPPQPIPAHEIAFVKEFYQKQPMGATDFGTKIGYFWFLVVFSCFLAVLHMTT